MAKDTMKEERMKILELLSKGTITADQAESLLAALGDNEDKEPEVTAVQKKGPFRMLKILVDSADGDQVRVELPIEFAKLLKNKKINMGTLDDVDLDVDMLIQMINSGVVGEIVNVKSADGDTVKILVE